MIVQSLIKPTPWDSSAFGIPTWEVVEYSEEALKKACLTEGHHSIKVDPLSDKRLLHSYGFYYCDTLIEPYCRVDDFRKFQHISASVSKDFDIDSQISICSNAFLYGRFQRDFNLEPELSNIRYKNWLLQLIQNHEVYGLHWANELAGFIGCSENSLVLHAISERFRGQGLAKYWWSSVCENLFSKGHEQITSSISAANLAVLNLYVSIGFSFRNPKDVYHRLVS